MYERILVPTDGSQVVEAAAAHAVTPTAATGARLHVLHVVDADAIGLVRPSQLDVDEQRTSLETAGERAAESVEAEGEADA